jgi:DNA repair exonuclease SbcCD ATPase subunit
MSVKVSRSVYIRVDLLEEVKRRKINLSDLVNTLLEEYLFGKNNNISEELLELRKLEKKLEEIEEVVKELEDVKKKLSELKAKLEEKQETRKQEEDATLITIIKEHFEDLEKEYAKHGDILTIQTFKYADPVTAINARLNMIAQKTKQPLSKVEELAKKHVKVVRAVLR